MKPHGSSVKPPTQLNTGLTTWVNQVGATSSESSGGLSIYVPATVGNSVSMLIRTSPTPPYTVKATLRVSCAVAASTAAFCGIGWRDSATGKLNFISVNQNAGTRRVYLFRFSDPVTFVGETIGVWAGESLSFRIQDDGANIRFAVGADLYNFVELASYAYAASYLGVGGYNQIMFGASSNTGSASPAGDTAGILSAFEIV